MSSSELEQQPLKARWGFRVKPARLAEWHGVLQPVHHQRRCLERWQIQGSLCRFDRGCGQKSGSPGVDGSIHGAPHSPCADPKPDAPFLEETLSTAPFGPKSTLQMTNSPVAQQVTLRCTVMAGLLHVNYCFLKFYRLYAKSVHAPSIGNDLPIVTNLLHFSLTPFKHLP